MILGSPPHMIKNFSFQHLILKLLDFKSGLHGHSHGWNWASDGFRGRTLLLRRIVWLLLQLLYVLLLDLNTAFGGIEMMICDGLVERNDFLSLIVLCGLSYLLLEDWLAFLIEKLYYTLGHHLLDWLFDLSVVESHVDVFTKMSANVVGEFLEKLHANLLHDAKVGSLGDFGNYLTSVLVVKIRLRLATLLFQLMLGDFLVEDMVEELVKVLLSELIVQLSTMGLNDIASPRRWAICQSIVLRQMDRILQKFLVLNSWVLQGNQTLGRGGVSLVVGTLPIILLHDLIEVSSCIFSALILQFLQERGKLLLDFSSLLFKLLWAVAMAGRHRNILSRFRFYVLCRDSSLLFTIVHLDSFLSRGCKNSRLLLIPRRSLNLRLSPCHSGCGGFGLSNGICSLERATEARRRDSLPKISFFFSWLGLS